MKKRRFGIFSRHELSSASFQLMEAITDELVREFLRNPHITTKDMISYLENNKVESNSVESVYHLIEVSVPRIVTILRAIDQAEDLKALSEEIHVIYPFIEACQEFMDRQKDVEPKRSLQPGYYY